MKLIDKLRSRLGIEDIIKSLDRNHRILNENNWANIFNSTIKSSEWFSNSGISPGRWALGYPALYVLYKVLEEMKPKNILEFGLGQSTKMLIQYGDFNKGVWITTVEHSEEWRNQFTKVNKGIPNHHIDILQLGETEDELASPYKQYFYKDLHSSIKKTVYDFVLVDGPFGSKHNSRIEILEVAKQAMNHTNFCIVLDDFNRPGEKQTIEQLLKYFESQEIDFVQGVYSGIKDTLVLCSINNRYLTSL